MSGELSLVTNETWENQPARKVLLWIGWVMLVAAVLSVAAAWAFSQPAMGAVGIATSSTALVTAGVLPDPRPAIREDVPEPQRLIARLEGHQLPV